MFFSLTQDTFTRFFHDIVYITNQHTKLDRVYDSNGSLFIKQLTRKPRSIDNAIDSLLSLYSGTSREEIQNDFIQFIMDLKAEKFVVSADSADELSNKMPHFSYEQENIKTLPNMQYANDLLHIDTTDFLYEYFRNSPQIFSFQMELTNRCNEKCRHCYLPSSRDTKDMDTRLAIDLIDQLAEEGTLGLTLSGGECLLHNDFQQILQHARKRDFSISILSNVTLLTDDLLNIIKETNINLLQVSLYSMIPQEHDWVTQVEGSHCATLKALEKLIAADIPIQISCPTMKKTYKSYKNVLEWAYTHRVKGYSDFIMMGRTDQSTDNLDNRLSYMETKELLEEMMEFDVEYKALLDTDVPFSIDKDLPEKAVCGAGTDSMCVTASGDFYPCAGFQAYPLGNAYKQTIRDVWQNSPAIKKLRSITWKDFSKCLTCGAKPFCSMCMVRNLNECGDIFSVNQHFCDVAFLNKELVEEYRTKNKRG